MLMKKGYRIEEFTNQDMNWFVTYTTNHLDYGIESFKDKNRDGKWDIDLEIKNYGKRFMPLKIKTSFWMGLLILDGGKIIYGGITTCSNILLIKNPKGHD